MAVKNLNYLFLDTLKDIYFAEHAKSNCAYAVFESEIRIKAIFRGLSSDDRHHP